MDLTAPIVVGLLTFTNWKVTFVILGLLGFIWVVIWNKVFTYETFAELAKQHFNNTLRGTITVTAGLGGMGGAQPHA